MKKIKLKPKGKKRITMVIRPGKTIKIKGKSPEIPEQDFYLVKDFFDGEPVEEKRTEQPEEKKDERKKKEVNNGIPDTKKS
jgi:hypothetical protein